MDWRSRWRYCPPSAYPPRSLSSWPHAAIRPTPLRSSMCRPEVRSLRRKRAVMSFPDNCAYIGISGQRWKRVRRIGDRTWEGRMLHRSASLATYIRDWTQRVGGLTRLPALIRQCGADPAALIEAAGIEADAFDEREGRVAYAALARLLNEAAVRTHCPHFGLLAGGMQAPDELGLAAQLALNSPTVRDAIETFVVYQHLNSAGGLTFVLERGGQVDFGYAVYHPEVQATRVLYDTLLAASLNFMRGLCGPRWLPSEVLIPYAQP